MDRRAGGRAAPPSPRRPARRTGGPPRGRRPTGARRRPDGHRAVSSRRSSRAARSSRRPTSGRRARVGAGGRARRSRRRRSGPTRRRVELDRGRLGTEVRCPRCRRRHDDPIERGDAVVEVHLEPAAGRADAHDGGAVVDLHARIADRRRRSGRATGRSRRTGARPGPLVASRGPDPSRRPRTTRTRSASPHRAGPRATGARSARTSAGRRGRGARSGRCAPPGPRWSPAGLPRGTWPPDGALSSAPSMGRRTRSRAVERGRSPTWGPP